MKSDRPLICWLEDCARESVPLVGGKNASLGELINAGVRVPPGFAVTTDAFHQFVHKSGGLNEIQALLRTVSEQDIAALEAISGEIRSRIESVPLPAELADRIGTFYEQLGERCAMTDPPVAVRSSATAEDLPNASFAGQQDTFLWICGVDDVLAKVRCCISSLFTARALAYRKRMDFDHFNVALSVGVQRMVHASAAGVMFTLSPITGDRSIIVIDSNFGFGESVVSGEVTPDHFVVNKVALQVVKRTIPRKTIWYALDAHANVCRRIELPEERQNAASISDDEAVELARVGKDVERHYGRPMDIEWAIDRDMQEGERLFILQARPETTWGNRQLQPVSRRQTSALEHILSSMMTGVRVR